MCRTFLRSRNDRWSRSGRGWPPPPPVPEASYPLASPILRVRFISGAEARASGSVVKRFDDGRLPAADPKFVFFEIAARSTAARRAVGRKAMRGPTRKRDAVRLNETCRLVRRRILLPGGNSMFAHGGIPILRSTGRCPTSRPVSPFLALSNSASSRTVAPHPFGLYCDKERRPASDGIEWGRNTWEDVLPSPAQTAPTATGAGRGRLLSDMHPSTHEGAGRSRAFGSKIGATVRSVCGPVPSRAGWCCVGTERRDCAPARDARVAWKRAAGTSWARVAASRVRLDQPSSPWRPPSSCL